MKDNLAQVLGFALNGIAVIGLIYYIFLVDDFKGELLFIIIAFLGSLVTGTILITIGKILAVLEDISNKLG